MKDASAMSLAEVVAEIDSRVCLGDLIYQVRERAGEDTTYEGSSWEHPAVVRYGALCSRLTVLLREAGVR